MNSLYYLSTIDKYLGKYNIFSPQEVAEADRLEKIQQESLQDLTAHQLLEIFPQAKPIVKRKLKEQIKQYKANLVKAEEVRNMWNNKVLSRVDPQHRWFWSALRDLYLTVYDQRFFPIGLVTDKLEQAIKRNYFFLSALKPNNSEEIKTKKITNHDIIYAKTFPIEGFFLGHLYKRGHTLVGKCPFHVEKTASFTIYTKNNRWHCFGCLCGGDVIDLIMKRNNLTFLEAVKYILNA